MKERKSVCLEEELMCGLRGKRGPGWGEPKVER